MKSLEDTITKEQLTAILKMANDIRIKHWSTGTPHIFSLPAGNPLREHLLDRLRTKVPDLVEEFSKKRCNMRKPEVLKAARFVAGLTVSSAAAVLNADSSEVVEWEESGVMSSDPQKEADRYFGLCKAMDSRVGGIVRDMIDKVGEHSEARFADWVIEVCSLMGLGDDQIQSVGQRIVDRSKLVRQRPALPEFAGHRLIEEFRLDSPTLAAELFAIQKRKLSNCMTFEQLGLIGQKFGEAFGKCGLQMADHVGTTLTYWQIDDDLVEDAKQCNCTAVSYVINGNEILVTAINRVVRRLKPGPIEKCKISNRVESEEWKEALLTAVLDGMR